jgi:hypothetical protein
MTNGRRIEVITSFERRRRWSAAEKQQVVAATLEPGASVSAVAREAGIMLSQLVDHPPRFRAINPSSDRNRRAKRFGHGVQREPRCWHQQRLRTTHIGTSYFQRAHL